MMGGRNACSRGVPMGVVVCDVVYCIFITSKCLVLGAWVETGYLGAVLAIPSVVDANSVVSVQFNIDDGIELAARRGGVIWVLRHVGCLPGAIQMLEGGEWAWAEGT